MLWLSVVAFLMAVLAAGAIVRWARSHATAYENGLPQRFHRGDVPRLGGLAIFAGIATSWTLGFVQTQYWGDPGSLGLNGWIWQWLLVMLPVVVGKARAARTVHRCTVVLVAVSLLPLAFGAGWAYGLGAVVGGLNFLRKTAALARAPHERARAMGAFFASMMQLSAIIAGVLIDAALR